jgi:hypothetical protein
MRNRILCVLLVTAMAALYFLMITAMVYGADSYKSMFEKAAAPLGSQAVVLTGEDTFTSIDRAAVIAITGEDEDAVVEPDISAAEYFEGRIADAEGREKKSWQKLAALFAAHTTGYEQAWKVSDPVSGDEDEVPADARIYILGLTEDGEAIGIRAYVEEDE